MSGFRDGSFGPSAFGAGFGASSQAPPSNLPVQQNQYPPFGHTQTTDTAFANSGRGFGSASPNINFGSAIQAPGPSLAFSASPNVSSSTPVASTHVGHFGQSNAGGGFGMSTPSNGFGNSTPTTTSRTTFANSASLMTPGAPPNNATTGQNALQRPFGTAAAANNPFGASGSSRAQQTTMTFAVSSNVVASQDATGLQPKPAHPFGGDTSGTQTGTPFGGNTGLNQFGTSQATYSSHPSLPANDNHGTMSDGAPASNFPVGQPIQGAIVNKPTSTSSAALQEQDAVDAKLAELKARLAAGKAKKKQKAAEERKKATEESEKGNFAHPENESMQLNAKAPSFAPKLSLADRNAARFSSSKTKESQLPTDLQNQSSEAMAANNALRNSGGKSGRKDLENATSLVGVCKHMCPDEELLRRERESDIQLLERPVADGDLHPQQWTLRNTMVKRFRRSAADYKLDVPEWVRPPDVLERVCSYLEEWVMERDRQGPDPRYKNAAPPPLDVYQFIWDRTRMVRKDFILQNFVGTGGLCDARATRCHERIARWHCMCEHQLSHIAQFSTMQSQQNIQELGQTMKTLNQYYDDSMGRSLVEVPDDNGNETRNNLDGLAYGIEADCVQGSDPVDYGGTHLCNSSENAAKRLIGAHAICSPHHGTAEPEMRGLYILLALKNDGGMEVLKYAARLFQERPEVYHTAPVQLALAIYKAENDYNYARFFSILRASSTPYLFACLMFKHVEHMRKTAIKICSKTYGSKSREGQFIYHEYPLRRLTRLLCFEDDDEARAACKHYNITVGEEKGYETVLWRTTQFREPVDPEKGSTVPLFPRKMMRTIESKLKGATRLAVCRGEVCGDKAFLSVEQVQFLHKLTSKTDDHESVADRTRARVSALKEWKKKEDDRIAVYNKKMKEKEILIRKEQEKRYHQKQLERKKLAAQMQHEQQREQEEQQRRKQEEQQAEFKRQELLQHEAALSRKAEQDALLKRYELEKEAEARRLETLRLRELHEQKQKEKDEAIRRQAEEKRRALEVETKRVQVENERRQKRILMLEEAERYRVAEEKRMLEETRIRQEAERLRLHQELLSRLDVAKKMVVWRRIIKRSAKLEIWEKSSETLLSLKSGSLRPPSFHFPLSQVRNTSKNETAALAGFRRTIEMLLQQGQIDTELSLPATLVPILHAQGSIFRKVRQTQAFLFKVAVIFPCAHTCTDESMCALVRSWLQTRIPFGKVSVAGPDSPDVRVVIVDGNKRSSSCDAALLVVPPPWSERTRSDEGISSLSSAVDSSIPRIILALHDGLSLTKVKENNSLLTEYLSKNCNFVSLVSHETLSQQDLQHSVSRCVDVLAETLVQVNPKRVERISLARFLYKCVTIELWEKAAGAFQPDLALRIDETILSAIDVIKDFKREMFLARVEWPPKEFASPGDHIHAYFGPGADLPLEWPHVLTDDVLASFKLKYDKLLRGSFDEVIQRLISGSDNPFQSHCFELVKKGLFRRSFELAFSWRVEADESLDLTSFLYLPGGQTEDLVYRVVSRRNKRNHFDDALSHHISIVTPLPQVEPEQTERPNKANLKLSDSAKCNKRTRPGRVEKSERRAPRTRKWQKRQRRDDYTTTNRTRASQTVSDSIAFTNKLERLVTGDGVSEVFLGTKGVSLSALLRTVPPLVSKNQFPPNPK